MTGIVIAGPSTRETFTDVFQGSSITVSWVGDPAAAGAYVTAAQRRAADNATPAAAAADFVLDLDFSPEPLHIAALAALPIPLILVNAVSTPLHLLGSDPRFARINAWNTFLQRPLAEVVAAPSLIDAVTAFCTAWGKTPEFLPDLPGMPSARVVSMIVNEAYLAWGQGVSTREAIDVAMRLGTNYPLGPFEWGTRIGLSHICELLEALAQDNPLYSIAPGLREEALAHGPAA